MTDSVPAREPEFGERLAVADARHEVIMLLPEWTLFRAGWRLPSGVQGSVYFRVGRGCGPTSRDCDLYRVAFEAATYWPVWEGQDYGIEILAMPPGDPLFPRWQRAVDEALVGIAGTPWRDLRDEISARRAERS